MKLHSFFTLALAASLGFSVVAQSRDPIAKMTESAQVKAYIMVSSLMPRTDLVLLAQSAATAHIPLILNGTVGAGFDLQGTQEWAAQLKQTCCEGLDLTVAVDPTLFSKYQINSVPSLVFVRGETEHTKITGVLALDEALKQVTQKSKLDWARKAANSYYLRFR